MRALSLGIGIFWLTLAQMFNVHATKGEVDLLNGFLALIGALGIGFAVYGWKD